MGDRGGLNSFSDITQALLHKHTSDVLERALPGVIFFDLSTPVGNQRSFETSLHFQTYVSRPGVRGNSHIAHKILLLNNTLCWSAEIARSRRPSWSKVPNPSRQNDNTSINNVQLRHQDVAPGLQLGCTHYLGIPLYQDRDSAAEGGSQRRQSTSSTGSQRSEVAIGTLTLGFSGQEEINLEIIKMATSVALGIIQHTLPLVISAQREHISDLYGSSAFQNGQAGDNDTSTSTDWNEGGDGGGTNSSGTQSTMSSIESPNEATALLCDAITKPWLLTFIYPDLENTFKAWHSRSMLKVDSIGYALTTLFMTVEAFFPYGPFQLKSKFGNYCCLGYIGLLPQILLYHSKTSRRWYISHRQLLLCYTWTYALLWSIYHRHYITVLTPDVMVSPMYVMGFTWTMVLALLFQLRLVVQVPLLLIMVSIDMMLAPQICRELQPLTGPWCFENLVFKVLVFCIIFPLFVLYKVEFKARQLFMNNTAY